MVTKEEFQREKKEVESDRDEEVDMATALDVARGWIKKNVGGNLLQLQFEVEQIKKNGNNTRYIVIISIVPDIGEERDYYHLKVNILDGKIILPIGKGKMQPDGSIVLREYNVDPKFEE
ncbi:hypothetical protein HQ533_03660 [Candidatus Woesearchaeota archaeon]|nr:hypothetical protein [Candidatus Woesearchaeota archaeon]